MDIMMRMKCMIIVVIKKKNDIDDVDNDNDDNDDDDDGDDDDGDADDADVNDGPPASR